VKRFKRLLKSKDFLAVCFLALLDLLFFRNFLLTDKMIYGGDVVGLNFPVEQFITEAFKSGKIPLWNPYAAAGYPFLPFSPTFYPPNIIFRILPTYLAFNYTYILHFLSPASRCIFWSNTLRSAASGRWWRRSFLCSTDFSPPGFLPDIIC